MARRAKGEGTLYQAKDKSWIYQYKLDGQRKTKRFQKKADAKAYIEALTAASPASSVEVIAPARQQNAAPSEARCVDRSLAGELRPAHHQAFYLLQLRTLCPRPYQAADRRFVYEHPAG